MKNCRNFYDTIIILVVITKRNPKNGRKGLIFATIVIFLDRAGKIRYNRNMFHGEKIRFNILSVLHLSFPESVRSVASKDYAVLSYRLCGKAELRHAGKRFSLNRNDVTFVPPGFDYTICSEEQEEVIVIHFTYESQTDFAFEIFTATQPEIFENLFFKLLRVWHDKPSGHVYAVDSLFLSVLENIEIQSETIGSTPLFLNLRRTINYMHANFSDPGLSIEFLAGKTGYCLSYFRRAFKDLMGVSPQKYLFSLRTDYATSLLKSGYYTVEQTAVLSGFVNTKYFSSAFKKAKGFSPSALLPHS